MICRFKFTALPFRRAGSCPRSGTSLPLRRTWRSMRTGVSLSPPGRPDGSSPPLERGMSHPYSRGRTVTNGLRMAYRLGKIVLDFRRKLWYWFVLQGGSVYAAQITNCKKTEGKTKRSFGSGCPDRGRALDYEGV